MGIVLASASPRRKSLLAQCGYPEFSIVAAEVTEIECNGWNMPFVAMQNAALKANAVARQFPGDFVIGADTVIEFEGFTIGKPADLHDAIRILMRLSGRTHVVTTGVCIRNLAKKLDILFAEHSLVSFLPFDRSVAEKYVSLVSVTDKAGAYAIQEHGDMLISETHGSYNNIIGLPTERLAETLSLVCGIAPENRLQTGKERPI